MCCVNKGCIHSYFLSFAREAFLWKELYFKNGKGLLGFMDLYGGREGGRVPGCPWAGEEQGYLSCGPKLPGTHVQVEASGV